MNNPASNKTFKPKQALAPTPQLYDELVGDGMEKLAKAAVDEMLPFDDGAIVLDAGCGTGAGTAAIIAAAVGSRFTIKGVDIDGDALTIYEKKAAENNWPVQVIKADAGKLDSVIADSTFTHALGSAFLFVLPDDGVPAIEEIYRTLKPGAIAAFNSWAYVPNMDPIRAASTRTRPEGTPELRGGMDKWSDADFLRSVVEKGGFAKEKINIVKRDVQVTTCSIEHYANMLWSFIGGTTTAGWLESDEQKWDEAIEIIKGELVKTDGCKQLDGGRLQLKFVSLVAVATK